MDTPFQNIEHTRQERAHALAIEVYERRSTGDYVPDEEVIAANPTLMPELFHELQLAKRVADVVQIAARTRPLLSIVEPLEADELRQTITEAHAAALKDEHIRPVVKGLVIACQIGSGGQAVVYRAVHESTGRTVALKVLTGGPWLDADHRSRFDRETEIMASLDHPHIVRIIDRGRTDDGAFYIAMEHVGGWSLDEFAADCAITDPAHPQRLLQVMAKVARAIDVAHQAGIVHRDLKPSNIRVDRHHEPRVLDFGLAADLNHADRNVTLTGQWIGSIPWSSPEQAARGTKFANAQTDVYSLGVVLYQVLCGRFPYDVTGPLRTVLDNIVRARPAPMNLKSCQPRYRRAAADVTLRALAKNPQRRYTTAKAFATALDRVAMQGRAGWLDLLRYTAIVLISLLATAIGVGLIYRDGLPPAQAAAGSMLPHRVNSVGMPFVQVRSGLLLLESPVTVESVRAGTEPAIVHFDLPFWLGTTEVTRKQYRAVMGAAPFNAGGDDLPMTGISFTEALEFCRRLSMTDGNTYRLPTEAEWEYACRSGGPATSPRDLQAYAWFADNAGDHLHPVAARLPNDFGLFDMLGNADEWVIPQAPGHESAWHLTTQPATNEELICRGGSFATPGWSCKPTARRTATPAFGFIGFRVVLDPTPPAKSENSKKSS